MMTSCPQKETLQAYLDGEMAAETRSSTRSHLNRCSICNATATRIAGQAAEIGEALAAYSEAAVPTLRLQSRLHSALMPSGSQAHSLKERLLPVAWLAATAIVVAGIIAWQRTDKPAVEPPQQPPVEETVTLSKPAPPTQQVPLTRSIHRHQQHHRVSNIEPAVTRFFPLREIEDVYAVDSLRLVRVELPKSAMAEAGLAFGPDGPDTTVKADVILGDDGVARAIRFVR